MNLREGENDLICSYLWDVNLVLKKLVFLMKLLFQMNFDKKHPAADFDTLYLGPKGGKEREWGKGSHPDHIRITSGISHSGRAIDWYSSKGVLARHRHASNLDNYKKVTCNLLRRYSIFIIYLQCVLISRSKFCYNYNA